MKVALALLLTLAGLPAARGGIDPVQDYLSNFSPLGGDKTIYSSDILYRLELDLDGDGQYEVLLSMARNQDGRENNAWSVYANAAAGYTQVGSMVFDSKSFYLGPIEDLGEYGLVTFRSTGEGEGTLFAYLFTEAPIRELEMTSVTRNSPVVDEDTGKPSGQAIVDKYMNRVPDGSDPLVSTNAATLAKQFGLKVSGDQPRRSISSSAASSQPSSASSDFGSSPSPSTLARTSASMPRAWLIVIAVLVAIGAVVWVKRNRGAG